MSPLDTASEHPTFHIDKRQFLPAFGVGWLFGCILVLLVRWAGSFLLHSPCEGHTLLALAVPLILGPGGLALAGLGWRRRGLGAMGLGLMTASLLPGLLVGAYDIGRLRSSGCAGGYVLLVNPASSEKSIETLATKAGTTVQLRGRIGGFTAQTHPESFVVSAESEGGIRIVTPKEVKVGEPFPVTVTVPPNIPANAYKAGVEAKIQRDSQTISAAGVLNIQVLPR